MISPIPRSRFPLCLAMLLTTSTWANAANPYKLQKKWTPGEVGASLFYSHDLAAEGNLMVTSAPNFDPKTQGQSCALNNCEQGAVFVFGRSGATWEFRQKIESPVPACVVPRGISPPTAAFGSSVAVDSPSTRIAVSCQPITGAEKSLGSVFIFEPNANGKFVNVARIDPPSSAVPDDTFGYEISLDGDILVVGAPRKDAVSQIGFGRVYVYERDSLGHWNLTATLAEASSILLGDSVTIEGETILVGAPREHTNGFWAGAAYVYRKNSLGGWDRIKQLLPPLNSGAYFGESVCISGSTFSVGAPFYPMNREGRIYSFDESLGWIRSELHPSGVQPNDEFGSVISADGNILGGWSPLSTFLGEVTLFENIGGTWVETQQLSDPAALPFSSFGSAFDIIGDYVLIGSRNQEVYINHTPQAGAHYVFATGPAAEFDFPRMGCGGTYWFVPELTLDGVPDPGGSVELRISNGLGGASALLLVGLSEATRTLCSPGNCCYCSLGLQFIPNIVISAQLTPGGPGEGTLLIPPFQIPTGTLPTPVYVQAIISDPWQALGHAVSNTAHFDI